MAMSIFIVCTPLLSIMGRMGFRVYHSQSQLSKSGHKLFAVNALHEASSGENPVLSVTFTYSGEDEPSPGETTVVAVKPTSFATRLMELLDKK